MTTSSMPVLYNFWRSSCSWRVRIALAWKGVEYKFVSVHLVKDGGENKEGAGNYKEAYTKMNPNQRVPALEINGHVLTQSGAILEYIEETHPERPLLPKDPVARAHVRSICLLVCADIQPMQNNSVMAKAVQAFPDSEKAAKMNEWGKYWIERGFVALEQVLTTTAGTYCVGDNVTMADLCVVPQVNNAKLFGVDMTQFPTITRVADVAAALPEFESTHPSKMPEAE